MNKLLIAFAIMFSSQSFSQSYPDPIGPYSHVVKAGNHYFASGQLGLDPKTNELRSDFDGQLQQILANTDALLKKYGLTRAHIVKTTIFVTSFDDYSLINKAYANYFSAPFPARSTVGVRELPKDALIEIEWVAYKVR